MLLSAKCMTPNTSAIFPALSLAPEMGSNQPSSIFFSSESAFAKQAEDARAMLRNTDYLMKELESHFAQLQPMRANDRSNTVYFRKPSDDIVNRYSLATMELEMAGKREAYAHVVVMPHARKAVLDRFLNDLKQDAWA
jgi:histidine decarboxylase